MAYCLSLRTGSRGGDIKGPTVNVSEFQIHPIIVIGISCIGRRPRGPSPSCEAAQADFGYYAILLQVAKDATHKPLKSGPRTTEACPSLSIHRLEAL